MYFECMPKTGFSNSDMYLANLCKTNSVIDKKGQTGILFCLILRHSYRCARNDPNGLMS